MRTSRRVCKSVSDGHKLIRTCRKNSYNYDSVFPQSSDHTGSIVLTVSGVSQWLPNNCTLMPPATPNAAESYIKRWRSPNPWETRSRQKISGTVHLIVLTCSGIKKKKKTPLKCSVIEQCSGGVSCFWDTLKPKYGKLRCLGPDTVPNYKPSLCFWTDVLQCL